MFERRLKIFIAALVLVSLMLLSRVFEVQVIGHAYWREKAAGLLTKPQVTETTRGRILDVNGKLLAMDSACTDACVDYRAIIDPPEPAWLKETVTKRLKTKFGAEYANAKGDQRKAMIADETRQTLADINTMWDTLAEQNPATLGSKNPRPAMEEIRKSIIQSVQSRRQWVSNHNKERDEERESASSRLMKWLGGSPADSSSTDSVGTLQEEEQPHVVLPALDSDACNFLGKRLEQFPGLVLRASTHRLYPMNDVACHLLGYLQPVNAADLSSAKRSDLDELRQYLPTDLIGRNGIEALCEPLLRGTRGKIERRISDNAIIAEQDFVPGEDVKLSIDSDLQALAQGLLQHVVERVMDDQTGQRELVTPEAGVSMHGAVVVLDVKTNEVRVLASNPGFDVNQLQDHYAQWLADDLNNPLQNRATSDTCDPGSTVKPMIGLGAITQGVLGPTETIDCQGYLTLPVIAPDGVTRLAAVERVNGASRCWILSENPKTPEWVAKNGNKLPPFWGRHGPLTFSDALERSCDIFFETTADRLGPDGVNHWLEEFGLGRPTGIGIYERPGMRPDLYRLKVEYPRGNNCLAGMGQGTVLATPLQIANEAATIARGGIWMRPRLLSSETQAALDNVHPRSGANDQVDLHLSPEALRQARLGMVAVVEGGAGTGKIEHGGISLAAKTGTADTAPLWVKRPDAQGHLVNVKLIPVHRGQEEGDTPWYRSGSESTYGVVHSWYMGYAPANNPQIAFCVLVEYAGAGGSVAAGPIAGQILEACDRAGYLHGE